MGSRPDPPPGWIGRLAVGTDFRRVNVRSQPPSIRPDDEVIAAVGGRRWRRLVIGRRAQLLGWREGHLRAELHHGSRSNLSECGSGENGENMVFRHIGHY